MAHTWTAKHTSVCIERSLSTSGRLLWEWLINHSTNAYKEVEFNLAKFNAWVAKRRDKGGYDPRTLKRAAEELVEKEIAIDLAPSRFKWNWKRWKLVDLLPQKEVCKPCQKRSKNADFGDSNEGESSTSTNNSSNKYVLTPEQEQIIDECDKAGMEYKAQTQPKVLDFPLNQVKIALAFWAYSYPDDKAKAKVRKPEGWLIDCLEQRWWADSTKFFGHVCAYDILPIEVLEDCFGEDAVW